MSTAWSIPTPPYEPDDEAGLRVVENAVLSPFAVGKREPVGIPAIRWTRGAVYDADGQLVPESLRVGGLGGDAAIAVDEPSLKEAMELLSEKDRAQGPERLPGTAVYVGNWMGHFGHFLTETLTTLWPVLLRPDVAREVTGRATGGYVGHHFLFGTGKHEYQTVFSQAVGLRGPITLSRGPGLRVDRLIVPSRPYVPNGYALPEAVEVWRQVGRTLSRRAKLTPERVYLSRTRFHAEQLARGEAAPRMIANEAALDDLFAARGFTVVHPEQFGVAEQVGLMARAQVVVGASGSALHLAAFAPEPIHVLEMGDVRSTAGLPNQQVIDAACGHRAAHLPFHRLAGGDPAVPEHDLAAVGDRLDDLLAELPPVRRPGRLKGLFART